MGRIFLSMEGGTTHLTADGNIYARPYHEGDEPVKGNVRVSKTLKWSGNLPAGKYVYRYELSYGEGKYHLAATSNDEITPFAKSTEFDGKDQIGLIWKFEVKS